MAILHLAYIFDTHLFSYILTNINFLDVLKVTASVHSFAFLASYKNCFRLYSRVTHLKNGSHLTCLWCHTMQHFVLTSSLAEGTIYGWVGPMSFTSVSIYIFNHAFIYLTVWLRCSFAYFLFALLIYLSFYFPFLQIRLWKFGFDCSADLVSPRWCSTYAISQECRQSFFFFNTFQHSWRMFHVDLSVCSSACGLNFK